MCMLFNVSKSLIPLSLPHTGYNGAVSTSWLCLKIKLGNGFKEAGTKKQAINVGCFPSKGLRSVQHVCLMLPGVIRAIGKYPGHWERTSRCQRIKDSRQDSDQQRARCQEATWGQKLHRKVIDTQAEEQERGLLLTCLTPGGRVGFWDKGPGRLETAGGRQQASSLFEESRVGRVKDCQAEVNRIKSVCRALWQKRSALSPDCFPSLF